MSEAKIAIKLSSSPLSPGKTAQQVSAAPIIMPAKAEPASTSGFRFSLLVAGLLVGLSIYYGFQMRAQLSRARTDNAVLLAQGNQMRVELRTAKANAQASEEQRAALQSQLDQAKAAGAQAQANADKAWTDAAGLQAQLGRANRALADAKANAEKISTENAALRSQLQAQAEAPEALSPSAMGLVPHIAVGTMPLPVSAVFEKASLGDGQSLSIRNLSRAALPVTVSFTHPDSSRSQAFHLVLDAGSVKELGSMGAWILASGDKIVVQSPGCASLLMTAP
jgi:hypothetical protein